MKLLSISIGLLALIVAAGCKSEPKKEEEKKVEAPKPKPGDPIKFDSSKRYIYLTWDDSPQPPGTVVCKDIFHKEGVKATFFAVGMHGFDLRRRRLVDEIRNSYPEFLLANHSYSHGFNNKYKDFYTHPDSAVKDFERVETEYKIPVKIIRLPGNNSWVLDGEKKGPKSTSAVYDKLDALGYSVIGWDVEWRFIKGSTPVQGAEEMVKEVNGMFEDALTVAPNAIVILAHDRMFAKPQYADSLTKFINILKSDPRNVFETIDHYPLIKYATKDTLNKKTK
ncbi:polysaccharide deacetylase family protein [Parasediminibacterium sp. JCM 36343]|uniref:polysaccharide deacetylase family protein n=1 Tax=Parasediminibacterium sp. JCM 36343 TaxID=3374279 RepID=UPI00397A819B